ncbi:hypothetical protein ACFX2I_014648 [Malus domestica]
MSCIRIFLESAIQMMTSGCKKRKPPKLSSILMRQQLQPHLLQPWKSPTSLTKCLKSWMQTGTGKSPLLS